MRRAPGALPVPGRRVLGLLEPPEPLALPGRRVLPPPVLLREPLPPAPLPSVLASGARWWALSLWLAP